ncbi:MAG: GDP-mannose 4,6-dehydratase, partial [candidate division WOR-3 bacterium]
MKKVLITGVAGFIGSHLAERFIREGYFVYGVDNFLT